MGHEIERRYRITGNEWRKSLIRSMPMAQGYLYFDPLTVRIRMTGVQAWLTLKGRPDPGKFGRDEFEYAVPIDDAQTLLNRYAIGFPVRKIRHERIIDGFRWEIDEFLDLNAGLILGEVELADEHIRPPLPPWAVEITGDLRFSNAALSQTPWQNRNQSERGEM